MCRRYHSVDEFATALRAVGEPMRGKPVSELSVGQMLDGLFAITRDFDMQTQPHLLLLQKTMVMVEGHRHPARSRHQHVGRLGAVRAGTGSATSSAPRRRLADRLRKDFAHAAAPAGPRPPDRGHVTRARAARPEPPPLPRGRAGMGPPRPRGARSVRAICWRCDRRRGGVGRGGARMDRLSRRARLGPFRPLAAAAGVGGCSRRSRSYLLAGGAAVGSRAGRERRRNRRQRARLPWPRGPERDNDLAAVRADRRTGRGGQILLRRAAIESSARTTFPCAPGLAVRLPTLAVARALLGP